METKSLIHNLIPCDCEQFTCTVKPPRRYSLSVAFLLVNKRSRAVLGHLLLYDKIGLKNSGHFWYTQKYHHTDPMHATSSHTFFLTSQSASCIFYEFWLVLWIASVLWLTRVITFLSHSMAISSMTRACWELWQLYSSKQIYSPRWRIQQPWNPCKHVVWWEYRGNMPFPTLSFFLIARLGAHPSFENEISFTHSFSCKWLLHQASLW